MSDATVSTPGALALAEALRQEGVMETPPGSNNTPFGVWFGSNSRPWCAVFVSWCFHTTGVTLCDGYKGPGVIAGKGCAWVPTIAAWLKERGWWRGPHETPQPGDIVLYDWGLDGALDHIGIVAGHVVPGNFTAIEGNSYNSVIRMSRNTSHVAGYGRIGG